MAELSPEYIEWARSLSHTKRGRLLLDYLIEHGSITTEGIREALGEKHPPSAVRDLRDRGVAVTMTIVDSIGLYQLDPSAPLRVGMVGRQAFSKGFKNLLISTYGPRCLICGTEYDPRYLQPDHRVPQRVGGDEADKDRDVANYMPVCRGCNRAKSFECERCPNWDVQDPEICRRCYWAWPDDYDHVATRPERREAVVWVGAEEVAEHDQLRAKFGVDQVATGIKAMIRRLLRE